MEVQLTHYTPLTVCSTSIRMCWDSHDKSDNGGEKDRNLIDRIGNKAKHESVKNHISYNFQIEGISTKTLMALTRHDVGTEFSVQSTRYTCKKKLKTETSFIELLRGKELYDFEKASNYITLTEDEDVNKVLVKQLELSRELVKMGKGCDDVALTLTQAYKYNLSATFSMQALQHFLKLRLEYKSSHYDIVELAENLALNIPEDHKYLFEDIVNNRARDKFKEVFTESTV